MEMGTSLLLANFSAIQWCVHKNMLNVFKNVLDDKFVHNVNVTQKKLDGGYGNPQRDSTPYTVINRKAIIPIHGTILKKAYCMDTLSGPNRTVDVIQDEIRYALKDPSIDTVISYIDSPGGMLPGTAETADLIYRGRSQKNMVTYASGMMCSAAMWMGAASDETYISHTTEVGSIGVYQMHIDQSVRDAMSGLKVTYIKAGKFKAMGNPNEPLTGESLAYIQASVNKTYQLFMADIAKFRGVDIEKVSSDWADARDFTGQEAVDVGLIDGVASWDDIINY